MVQSLFLTMCVVALFKIRGHFFLKGMICHTHRMELYHVLFVYDGDTWPSFSPLRRYSQDAIFRPHPPCRED